MSSESGCEQAIGCCQNHCCRPGGGHALAAPAACWPRPTPGALVWRGRRQLRWWCGGGFRPAERPRGCAVEDGPLLPTTSAFVAPPTLPPSGSGLKGSERPERGILIGWSNCNLPDPAMVLLCSMPQNCWPFFFCASHSGGLRAQLILVCTFGVDPSCDGEHAPSVNAQLSRHFGGGGCWSTVGRPRKGLGEAFLDCRQ